MKVLLVKVSAPSEFKKYKKAMGAPPQNIFAAAAATPSDIDVEIVDETMEMKLRARTDADIIGLFFSTPDANRAYNLAQTFKKRGKTVVFAGLHPTFMPDEALTYGDAVLIGEIEGIWEQMLQDYQNGQLKQRYECTELPNLETLKPYPLHLVDMYKYYDGIWSVVVSRGCRFKCSYCLVSPFFKKHRYRPIGAIVDEIRKVREYTDWMELHSDNLLANRDYACELFEAIKPLHIKWMTEMTITLADDEELLQLAAESGLKSILVGLETPSPAALKAAGKGFMKIDKIKTYMERLHAHEIHVDSSFIFGFDQHDKNIFPETFDFVQDINLDGLHSVILIPFPGSRTFQELEKNGRILTKDWSRYDGAHAVFQPALMSPGELESGAWWFHRKTRSFGRPLFSGSSWSWK